jgi:hypothetical protein
MIRREASSPLPVASPRHMRWVRRAEEVEEQQIGQQQWCSRISFNWSDPF